MTPRYAVALTVTLLLGAGSCARHTNRGPNAALEALVDNRTPPAFVARSDDGRAAWRETQRFYRENGARLAWSDGARLSRDAGALADAVRQSADDGLNPQDYGADVIGQLAGTSVDDVRAPEVDARLTYAYGLLAADLAHGASDPEDLNPHWRIAKRDVDIASSLRDALIGHRIAESLARLAPTTPQYATLKAALARARAPGADPAAAQAAATLAINMDRWRWLPDDLGAQYLLVNVPAFELTAVEHGRPLFAMKVVTGKPDNPTPLLADRMTAVVFSPYWNIPPDIAEKEMLPKLASDPDYLARHNIEVVNGAADQATRFRQRPGKGNSLGSVKFVLTNHQNVYLHDTPARALFNRVERDFSHGCVRLEQPAELARYVLRDQPAWTSEKIDEAMQSGVERTVALRTPIPVYLVYFTAWADRDSIRYYDDVYGYDGAPRARRQRRGR